MLAITRREFNSVEIAIQPINRRGWKKTGRCTQSRVPRETAGGGGTRFLSPIFPEQTTNLCAPLMLHLSFSDILDSLSRPLHELFAVGGFRP